MVTLDNYNDDPVAACKSVLVEAFTVLGRHRRHLVLVGGWVPPLLMPGTGHTGSIDVDLAIDSRQVTPHLYETIGNDLRKAGYFEPESPDHWSRRQGIHRPLWNGSTSLRQLRFEDQCRAVVELARLRLVSRGGKSGLRRAAPVGVAAGSRNEDPSRER